ncbi:MAG: aspartate carbamoyltransferase [Thermoplasmata archaeon]|nr:aspartate carbamoyltransferase [Thermoplasmata archaeon]
MEFENRDIISIHDFSTKEILHVLDVARDMVPAAQGKEEKNILGSKVMSSLFFEPSTRTRLSFEAAMKRLGGKTVGFSDAKSTSTKKGETLADTIRMAEAYSDCIVIRHFNEGAGRLAAKFSSKPVLNAGDGAGQHPTQTLLDLFTIREEKGAIKGNRVILAGDLKYGRTVHSLAYALAMFGVDMAFISPRGLEMPREFVSLVKEMGVDLYEGRDLAEAVAEGDVLYATRIQKERFPDPQEYKKMASSYRIDNEMLSGGKKGLIVMHPLPRVNEIAAEVDDTPHAVYFRQAFNGVPVRMALLALVLGARR